MNGANAQRVWDVRPAVTSANGVSAQAQRAHPDADTQDNLRNNRRRWRIRARNAGARNDPSDSRPFAQRAVPGQGVSAQRINLPQVPDNGQSHVPSPRRLACRRNVTPDTRPFADHKGRRARRNRRNGSTRRIPALILP